MWNWRKLVWIWSKHIHVQDLPSKHENVCESPLSTGEKLLMLFGGDLLPLWPLLGFESCISEDSGLLRRKEPGKVLSCSTAASL